MTTTYRGKRSVLLHLNAINFDFNKLVDVSFRTLLTAFLPLSAAIDILLMFLVEGNKIIFRFTYALMKVHKKYIKSASNA